MSESLSVSLNDDRLHEIRTATAFEATGSFPLLLKNGDAPVHVHLHLDDALSEVATIPANNHYVDADSTRQVTVEVRDGAYPVEGRLKIVTGHGAETEYIDISIVEPEDREDAVDIDGTLATPAAQFKQRANAEDTNEGDAGGLVSSIDTVRESAPVLAFAVFAVLVAGGSAVLSHSGVVFVGALVVVGSVLVAGYLLVG
ncbi:DUF7524 family protein [Halorussus halophilus]|uniref:DUF7524 family protein n=1 Tax=Halorussus halophilus TaxID=2650975 RepID=UPI001300CE4C|nr:hypothetical protein [Halorussus halophilus]